MILKRHHRRKFVTRSLVAQTIIQFITFGSAILSYHYFVMPQIKFDAYQDGSSTVWRQEVEKRCPPGMKADG
jgi:hypothetical protein